MTVSKNVQKQTAETAETTFGLDNNITKTSLNSEPSGISDPDSNASLFFKKTYLPTTQQESRKQENNSK